MSKIILGKLDEGGPQDGKNISLDLDTLLRTRLLIQANSGKGKSWLLRRLAEQLFGKVQVIIIDPEGEFATLREQFAYVLVGKGGETAAHPRIAALTAQRLLELRACAVCDLYEMKPTERHSYVQLFLESLIDAPKALWHPLIVILDEAHMYCPEKGAGESVASESVISMATRGRKRGYCLVAATQRLGKFRKDAAAELTNVAIGGTFMDVDRKRAADALGVYGPQLHPFFEEIRLLEAGKFFFLGPAVSTERLLITVGPVETTHPKAGSAKHAADAPPTPEKIKALLPSLADLPKEAETKAKTEQELRTEIRSLKAQLSAAPKAAPAVADSKAIERAVTAATKPLLAKLEAYRRAAREAIANFVKAAGPLNQLANASITEQEQAMPDAILHPPAMAAKIPIAAPVLTRRRAAVNPAESNGDLSGPEQRILDAIAWMESISVAEPKHVAVAFLAGYSPNGGAFTNPRGALRSRGYVEYIGGDRIKFTDEGRQHANTPAGALDTAALHARILARLDGAKQRILAPLLKEKGVVISNEELAAAAGYNPNGGAYTNPRGALRSLELVEYVSGGVKAADFLFLD